MGAFLCGVLGDCKALLPFVHSRQGAHPLGFVSESVKMVFTSLSQRVVRGRRDEFRQYTDGVLFGVIVMYQCVMIYAIGKYALGK